MPRIVVLILLVAGLAAGNRYAPGVIQAVLALVALYLAVTHAPKLGGVFVDASAGLARGFGQRPSTTATGGGGSPRKG